MRNICKLLAICLLLISCSLQANKLVCFKGVCLKVEVADTEEKRAKGLMFREELGEKEGMLFIFPEEDMYNFWMKNTLIPLDIIWINQKKEVVDIKTYVQPCRELCPDIVPRSKAMYVLEASSGFVNKNKVKIGDKVRF